MADPRIVLSAVDKTRAAFDSVLRNFRALDGVAAGVTSKFGSLGSMVAGVFAGISTASVIQLLDSLDELAEKSGVSVEQLSALRYAGEAVGTSQDALAAGVRRLSLLMAEAAGGSEQAQAKFAALGISMTRVREASPDELLLDLADRFASYRDGANKAALANEYFGKTGSDMIPLLNQGRDGVARLTDEAKSLGAVYGSDLAKAAADFNDNLAKLKLGAEAAAVAVAGPLVKALRDSTTDVVKATVAYGSLWEAIKDYPRAVFSGGGLDDIDATNRKLAETRDKLADASRRAADPTLFDFTRRMAQISVDKLSEEIGLLERRRKYQVERLPDLGQSDPRELARRGRLAGQAQVAAPVIPSGSSTSTAVSEYEKLIARIRERGAAEQAELAAGQALTEADKFGLDIVRKLGDATAKLTDAQKQRAAAELDAVLALIRQNETRDKAAKARDAEVEATSRVARARLDELDQLVLGNRELEREIELIGKDTRQQAAIEAARVAATRALKEEERARRVAAGATDETLQQLDAEIEALQVREGLIKGRAQRTLLAGLDAAVKPAGEDVRSTLADSIEQGILDGFRSGRDLTDIFLDELKAQFAKTVLRPLIEPVAAANNKLIEMLVQMGASYFTANSASNPSSAHYTNQMDIGYSHATGLSYVPYDDYPARLHKGERVMTATENARSGGGTQVNIINQAGAPVSQRQRRLGGRDIVDVMVEAARDAVVEDIGSGGRVDRAMSAQYGLNRSRGLSR